MHYGLTAAILAAVALSGCGTLHHHPAPVTVPAHEHPRDLTTHTHPHNPATDPEAHSRLDALEGGVKHLEERLGRVFHRHEEAE